MRRTVTLATTLIAGWTVIAAAQQPSVLPMGPARERGASITPAYEGWYRNDDGSFSMLIGYYNRNSKEALTIPVGPNNQIEPGDPDQGQPTFFEMGRQWGVFVIKVPKDFGDKVDPLDDHRQRRNAVGAVLAEQGLSDHAVQGARHGQPAADAVVQRGRRESHRAAGRHRRQLQRRRQSAGRDHGLCRRREGEGQQGGQRGHASRCTSIAVPATSPSSAPASRCRKAGEPITHRRRSPRRANTCCACRPTMNRVKAAAAFSVAGPIPTSK